MGRRLFFWLAVVLPVAGLSARAGWAQSPTDLCASRAPAMGPDWLLPIEFGAGANTAAGIRPWRFTGRLGPTYLFDRRHGLGLGATMGAASAHPVTVFVGPRATARLLSLLNLTGFQLPGAEIQVGAEYGFFLGSGNPRGLSVNLGIELVDLARVGLRVSRITAYGAGTTAIPAQTVVEFAIGRTIGLHTPRAPALPPLDPATSTSGYVLGRTEALAITVVPAQDATDSTAAEPPRCDPHGIAALVAFVQQAPASYGTRAELLAALRAADLTTMADRIDQFFPDVGLEPEAKTVRDVMAGIRSLFPRR